MEGVIQRLASLTPSGISGEKEYRVLGLLPGRMGG